MSELSELGLQLLTAARAVDPDWEQPAEGTPVRSYVAQDPEDDELLAIGVEVGDVRYWVRLDDPAFEQSTTWKHVQQHGRSIWKIWGEGAWREIADAPPFAPSLN
jgi:hypothetical protein